MRSVRSLQFVRALVLIGLIGGCQKAEEHPPFAEPCRKNCGVLPGISLNPGPSNTAGAGGTADAGSGSLQGTVVQVADDTFINVTPYRSDATVTADGANGTPVSGTWLGSDPDPDPFSLDGVARSSTIVGSSRVDLQACKLEYSIVSPK